MVFLFAGKEFIGIGFNGNGLGSHTQTIHGLCMEINPIKRSKNVALSAVSRAFASILSGGGPAKCLKNINLSNQLRDLEPVVGGSTTRRFGRVGHRSEAKAAH